MKRSRVAPSRVRPALSATSTGDLAAEDAVEDGGDQERDDERDARADPGGSIDREHGQGHSARCPRNLDRIRESGPASAIRVAAPRLSGRPLEEAERGDPRRDHVLPGAPARGPRRRLAARPARALRGGDGARRGADRDGARRAARRPALLRLPRQRADAARAAGAGDPARRGLQLGLVAARAPGRDGPHAARSTARSPPPRSGRPSRTARSSARRCELAGTTPEQTWHVGDTPAADVEGARAAGITPVLIAREGAPRRPARSVRSPNSYPWPQLDRREQRVPRLARARGAVDARRRAAAPPPDPARSRCGRRSWRWPPRCSSSC